MNIYVGNLPYNVEADELKGYFEEYGEVSSVRVITDKFTGKNKGFAFVEMPNEEQAKKAIDELDEAELDGRTIVVNIAEERKPQDKKKSQYPRRFNNNSRGNNPQRNSNRNSAPEAN